MDPNEMTSESASQTSNASNHPLPRDVEPTFPSVGDGIPTSNHTIALQQYQFEQSLINQQLLAQQQAVAHAVSIKAAAERAAARAVEISKLLNSEKNDIPEGISVDLAPIKDESGLKSSLRSPSPPQSSKLKSISPIKNGNSCREHQGYPQRDQSSWTCRDSSYSSRYNDNRNYSRSSYRRDEDHSGSRSYVSYHRYTSRSRSRSRRSSPLSRSMRYHRDDSRSSRRNRTRSPSAKSGHRIFSGVPNRCNISKSPIHISSRHRAREPSPRKETSRRSLSSSEKRSSRRTTSIVVEENKVDNDISTRTDNSVFNLDGKWREEGEGRSSRENFRGGKTYSSRSTSDYSGKRSTHEPPSSKGRTSDNEVDIFEHRAAPDECAIYPLPEALEDMDRKDVGVYSPLMVLDGHTKLEDGEVSRSPKTWEYPEKAHKWMSISRGREKKHHKRHHKSHHRESKENVDQRRGNCKEKKLKKDERKASKVVTKKRKHGDTSSSSSPDGVEN